MCLDITLEISLGSKIDPETPIFTDSGDTEESYCIQHLEELFLRKYSLALRIVRQISKLKSATHKKDELRASGI